MPSPFTTDLPAYDFAEKDVSQGHILGYFGGYAEDRGEPVGGWTPFGMIEPSGFNFGDKPTFAENLIDGSLGALTAFLTKRERDLKIVVSHIRPEIRNLFFGYKPSSLVITPGTSSDFGTKVQGGGEFADIGNGGDIVAGGGDDPSNEIVPHQVMFVFLSPGFNFSTTPTGKWAYVRFFKAYAHSPTEITHSKEKKATMGCTFRGLTDLSISGPDKVFEIYNFSPKVP